MDTCPYCDSPTDYRNEFDEVECKDEKACSARIALEESEELLAQNA